MAMYQLTSDGMGVIRTADGALIPNDSDNRYWREYQAWLAAGNTPDPVPAVVVTNAMVNAERDRRAALGFTYNGVVYQSDSYSLDAIDRNAMLAFVAITNGASAGDLRWSDPNADFYWIAADNRHINMDARTLVGMAQASAAFSTNLTMKASTLKALSPIPSDYTADNYWS